MTSFYSYEQVIKSSETLVSKLYEKLQNKFPSLVGRKDYFTEHRPEEKRVIVYSLFLGSRKNKVVRQNLWNFYYQ